MIPIVTTRKAPLAFLCCIVLFLLATSSACRTRDVTDGPVVAEGVATSSVVAQERSITSVLTLEGVVVVNPFIRIAAPQDGVLVSMTKGRVGIAPAQGSAGVPVELPESTEIVSLLVKPGTRVTAGLPIINARYTGFAIQAAVPPEQVYRLYDGVKSVKAQVKVGPGPFDTSTLGVPYPPGSITLPDEGEPAPSTAARVNPSVRYVQCDYPSEETESVALPSSEETSGPSAASAEGRSVRTSPSASKETSTFPVVTSTPDAKSGVVLIVRSAPGLTLIEGMPARVAIVTAEQSGVALPLEAVAGISQKGQIYVVSTGGVELRSVTLGITDGSYVIVTSGLKAGEVVQIPSPSIIGTD